LQVFAASPGKEKKRSPTAKKGMRMYRCVNKGKEAFAECKRSRISCREKSIQTVSQRPGDWRGKKGREAA